MVKTVSFHVVRIVSIKRVIDLMEPAYPDAKITLMVISVQVILTYITRITHVKQWPTVTLDKTNPFVGVSEVIV